MSGLAGLERAARDVGQRIGTALPKGVGFVLMLFTFGEGGWSTYVSNAARPSMVLGIRELLEKLEGDAEWENVQTLVRELRDELAACSPEYIDEHPLIARATAWLEKHA